MDVGNRGGERGRAVPLAALLIVLLVAVYPLHTYVGWPARLNVSAGDVVIAVVGPLWLLGVVGVRRLPRFTAPLAAFLAVVAVSIVVAFLAGASYLRPGDTALELGTLLGALAWFLGTFALLVEDARDRTRLLAGASVLVALAFGLVTLGEGVLGGATRPTGPFENPNLYGNYLVLNGFLAAYLVDSMRGEAPARAGATALAIPVLVAAVLVTASRGALLGLAVGAASLLLLYPRGGVGLLAKPALAGPALASAIGALVVLAYDRGVRDRLTSTFSPDAKNLDSRLRRWEIGVEGFRENPLTGVGFGQSQNYVRSEGYGGPYPRLHNTHLTVLCETGVVGAVAFAVLFASVLLEAARLARTVDPAYAFLGGAVAATLGQGLVTGVLTFRSLWVATGSIAALSVYHRGGAVHLEDVVEWIGRRLDALDGSIERLRS